MSGPDDADAVTTADPPPRVFADGVLTLAVGAAGVRAYVGVHEVPLSAIQVDFATGQVTVSAVPAGRGLEREQALRVVRSLPWVRVS